MTNREKFIEVFGGNPQRHHITKSWWDEEYVPLQEPKMEQFAKWVATEIFDENWEYNKDAFGELACRKLAKLGIVKENGNQWELVEQESEDER